MTREEVDKIIEWALTFDLIPPSILINKLEEVYLETLENNKEY